MKLTDVVSRLRGLGIVLGVDGTQLRYTAPKGAMTPAILTQLRQNKPLLVELLTLEARCAEIHKRVGELVPAAETNELLGDDDAKAYAVEQWKEIGDLIEEGLSPWERLQELRGTEIPDAELAEVA